MSASSDPSEVRLYDVLNGIFVEGTAKAVVHVNSGVTVRWTPHDDTLTPPYKVADSRTLLTISGIASDTPSLALLKGSLSMDCDPNWKRFLNVESHRRVCHYLPVWKFPLFLTPDDHATHNIDYSNFNSAIKLQTYQNLDLTQSPQRVKVPRNMGSGSGLNPMKTFAQSALVFQYVPGHINVVFVLGPNASGKSLILKKWKDVPGTNIHVVTPAPALSKDVTGDAWGSGTRHIKLPEVDRRKLDSMVETAEKMEEFATWFNDLTGGRWSLITHQYSKGKEQQILFLRAESGEATPFTYGMVSDGLRQLFHILLQLSWITRPAVIVLDEPESHLHPALYLNLVQKYLLPQFVAHGTKLVIATHNFHVVESISTVQIVNSMIVEVRSQWPYYYEGHIGKEYFKPTTSDILLSDVSMECREPHIFLQSPFRGKSTYSPELMQDMTNQKQVVLYCESLVGGFDCEFYTLLFDPAHVEVRSTAMHREYNSAAGSCDELTERVAAARKGRELLQTQSPILYYGIRDRDRRIFPNRQIGKDVITLPCAELENVLWSPPLWCVLPHIVFYAERGFDTLAAAETVVNIRLEKFLTTARSLIRQNFLLYLSEYAVAAQELCISECNADVTERVKKSSLPDRCKIMRELPQLIKNSFEPYACMVDRAAQILNSDFAPCTIDDSCDPLTLLSRFYAMATDDTAASITAHYHLLNAKPILHAFSDILFNFGDIGHAYPEVPKFDAKHKEWRVLTLYKCVILETHMFANKRDRFRTTRRLLLECFNKILSAATYPSAIIYSECKRNLTEFFFRK